MSLVSEPLSALLGREAELGAFERIITEGLPAFVLVEGGPRMGKSTFLQAIRERALDAGWRVVPTDSARELRIGANTSIQSFIDDITADLGELHVAVGDKKPTIDLLDRLLNSLTISGPSGTILLVAGYAPTPAFGEWFVEKFMQTVVRGTAPTIVVVADHPEALQPLGDNPGVERIRLGPLDRESVAKYLKDVGLGLSPRMAEQEFEVYLAAVCKEPEVLNSLSLVLALGRASSVSAG